MQLTYTTVSLRIYNLFCNETKWPIMISFNPKSLLLPINTYLQFFSFLHRVLNG